MFFCVSRLGFRSYVGVLDCADVLFSAVGSGCVDGGRDPQRAEWFLPVTVLSPDFS